MEPGATPGAGREEAGREEMKSLEEDRLKGGSTRQWKLVGAEAG